MCSRKFILKIVLYVTKLANIVFSQKQLKSLTHPIQEISEAYSKKRKFPMSAKKYRCGRFSDNT